MSSQGQPATMSLVADQSSTDSTAPVQSVTPSYRRNGKLFSCEPCRRGKLRCDHNSPVCGRCARRGKSDQCIYHPAPLTKPRTDPPAIGPRRTTGSTPKLSALGPYPTPSIEKQPSGLASPPSSAGTKIGKDISLLDTALSKPPSQSHTPVLPSPTANMAQTPGDESKHSSGASASYTSPESAMSFIRDGRTGFLGPTSYSAVYTENSSILQTPDVDDPPDLPSLPADKIQQGAEVLSMLRDLPVYRRFTQRWFELCDGIVVLQPVFRIWIDELWSEFGQILAEGKPEQMRTLSELVWRNTRRPMRVHGSMTAREWAKAASGRNLRWEVVGIVLSLVGIVAVNLSNWDTIFDSIRERYVDRATFAERMRKASEYCLCFCYESEVLNDIYVCFMFEDLVLVECLKGDAHYAAWQRTGEVCDAIVAMGLHQGNRPGPECPFFLAELRKKIFVSAYGHDKVVATFLGRPPRLSHRYCKMEYPLDLSDEQLFSEGAELEAALATLDENGWNTIGCMNRTTWMRVWFQHCRIREDILEIAMGSEDDRDIEIRAQIVRTKMDELHSSGPCHIQITPEEILSDNNSPLGVGLPMRQNKEAFRQVNAMFVLCIHTGIIHTEFLLQRALTIRTRADTQKLIPIARRMLKLVLLAQSRRDFFRDFQGDIIYLLALHGLPAAGVLAVELLIECQTRRYAPDVLPRSETIQDLSVFISALGSVGPGEGNYSICNQGRKALARVLDQILSPNPPPPLSAIGEPLLDDSSLYFPIGNDADFLQWLENVEWDKSNWIDPPPLSLAGQGEPAT